MLKVKNLQKSMRCLRGRFDSFCRLGELKSDSVYKLLSKNQAIHTVFSVKV